MPELPEVETVVRGLNEQVKGREVLALVHCAPHLRRRDARLPSLVGEQFIEFTRRGKYIIARLSSARQLLIHLRMSGRLLLLPPAKKRDKHAHLILRLSNTGEHLIFHDTRKFGVVEFLDERHSGFHSLGPEATRITGSQLTGAMKGVKRSIKAFLLDQTKLAGIGNIYADEALHRAGIRPARLAMRIKPGEARVLARAIRLILQSAIRRMGTTFDSYIGVNGKPGEYSRHLKVYNRKGDACRRCGSTIRKTRVAGRGTHYCPGCQF